MPDLSGRGDMPNKNKASKKGVLADHQRKGKTFVPPFTAQLGSLREIYWIKTILPELLWIALLHRVAGLRKGVQLAQDLAKTAGTIRHVPGAFGTTSSFYHLNHDEFRQLRSRLITQGHLFDLQNCLYPLVALYPECPLRGLFTSTPDDPAYLSKMKYMVAQLYNKTTREAVLTQSTFIYLAFDAGILRVREGLALADLPLIEDYPNSERSRVVAASVRAAISMLLGTIFYEKPSPWPNYFWNRGLELEACLFSFSGGDDVG